MREIYDFDGIFEVFEKFIKFKFLLMLRLFSALHISSN